MRRLLSGRASRCWAVLLMSLFVATAVAAAAEFSADFTEKMAGRSSAGKLHIKGLKVRRETTQGPQKGILILRLDKGKIWVLDPAQKTYLEMDSAEKDMAYRSPDDPRVKASLKQWGEMKRVGRETISGYPCDKYAFTFRDKSMGTQYLWVSRRLKVPLRVEQKSANFSMLLEYTNVKEGRVADSLFELPKGYRKMSAPGLGGRRGGRGRPGMRGGLR